MYTNNQRQQQWSIEEWQESCKHEHEIPRKEVECNSDDERQNHGHSKLQLKHETLSDSQNMLKRLKDSKILTVLVHPPAKKKTIQKWCELIVVEIRRRIKSPEFLSEQVFM